MKKILIIFIILISFSLASCTSSTVTSTTTSIKIDYIQNTQWSYFNEVNLLENIFWNENASFYSIPTAKVFDFSLIPENSFGVLTALQSEINRIRSYKDDTLHYYFNCFYIKEIHYVQEYSSLSYKTYLTDEFVNDLSLLKDHQITKEEFYQKYGNYIIIKANMEYSYEVTMTLSSQVLTGLDLVNLTYAMTFGEKEEQNYVDYFRE